MSIESISLDLNIDGREVPVQIQERGETELSISFLRAEDRREFTFGSLVGGSDKFRSKIHDEVQHLYPGKECFVTAVSSINP